MVKGILTTAAIFLLLEVSFQEWHFFSKYSFDTEPLDSGLLRYVGSLAKAQGGETWAFLIEEG